MLKKLLGYTFPSALSKPSVTDLQMLHSSLNALGVGMVAGTAARERRIERERARGVELVIDQTALMLKGLDPTVLFPPGEFSVPVPVFVIAEVATRRLDKQLSHSTEGVNLPVDDLIEQVSDYVEEVYDKDAMQMGLLEDLRKGYCDAPALDINEGWARSSRWFSSLRWDELDWWVNFESAYANVRSRWRVRFSRSQEYLNTAITSRVLRIPSKESLVKDRAVADLCDLITVANVLELGHLRLLTTADMIKCLVNDECFQKLRSEVESTVLAHPYVAVGLPLPADFSAALTSFSLKAAARAVWNVIPHRRYKSALMEQILKRERETRGFGWESRSARFNQMAKDIQSWLSSSHSSAN